MGNVDAGLRLRAARTARGLSVRQLAELSGCSASSISQIERGIVQPRVDTLVALTVAMHMSVAQLLSDDSGVTAPLRLADRVAIHNGALRREFLLTRSPVSSMEVYQVSIEPGGSSEEGLVVHGDSQEFCLVLDGHVVLELGDNDHEMSPGDCMEYRSSVPHAMVNPGRKTAEILWVISPPDHGGDRRLVGPTRTKVRPGASKSSSTPDGSRQ